MKRSLHSGCILYLLNNAHLFNTVCKPVHYKTTPLDRHTTAYVYSALEV